MRDQFAPVIEGFDCNRITNPWSFQCETFFEDGGNGGTMLDGATVHDVLATKKRFSWSLNVLTYAQYTAFVTALSSGSESDTVSATVFYPDMNVSYTATFHVTPPVFRFIHDIDGAIVALANNPLVLEEVAESPIIRVTASGDGWTLYDDGTLIINGGKTLEDILDELDEYAADVIILILPDNTEPTGADDGLPNLQETIWVAAYPSKSRYAVNSNLDYSGLSVMKREKNGEELNITSECALIPANGTRLSDEGNFTLKIQYNNRTIGEFAISVTKDGLPALRIYVENDVLVVQGEGASVSGNSLAIVSDDVSVSNNVFHADTT